MAREGSFIATTLAFEPCARTAHAGGRPARRRGTVGRLRRARARERGSPPARDRRPARHPRLRARRLRLAGWQRRLEERPRGGHSRGQQARAHESGARVCGARAVAGRGAERAGRRTYESSPRAAPRGDSGRDRVSAKKMTITTCEAKKSLSAEFQGEGWFGISPRTSARCSRRVLRTRRHVAPDRSAVLRGHRGACRAPG